MGEDGEVKRVSGIWLHLDCGLDGHHRPVVLHAVLMVRASKDSTCFDYVGKLELV